MFFKIRPIAMKTIALVTKVTAQLNNNVPRLADLAIVNIIP
jgi:hypothetical protein